MYPMCSSMAEPLICKHLPFYFSKPLALINEGCTEGDNEYSDKSLALWELKDIYLGIFSSILFINRLKYFIQHKINLWLSKFLNSK